MHVTMKIDAESILCMEGSRGFNLREGDSSSN